MAIDAASVVVHRLEFDVPVMCLLADRLLVVAVGQLEGYVQSGGDTPDGGFGERCGERLNERVTPAAVAGSHTPQIAVEFAPGQP